MRCQTQHVSGGLDLPRSSHSCGRIRQKAISICCHLADIPVSTLMPTSSLCATPSTRLTNLHLATAAAAQVISCKSRSEAQHRPRSLWFADTKCSLQRQRSQYRQSAAPETCTGDPHGPFEATTWGAMNPPLPRTLLPSMHDHVNCNGNAHVSSM